jgi:ketosteroid isomerase-like protein
VRPGEAVKDLDQAFTRPDTEAALSFYEDSAAAVVHSGRVIRGKEELRKYFTQLFALNGKANQLHTRVIEADDIVLVDIEVALCGRGSRRSAVLTRSRGNQRAAERHRWQLAYSD